MCLEKKSKMLSEIILIQENIQSSGNRKEKQTECLKAEGSSRLFEYFYRLISPHFSTIKKLIIQN